MAQMSIAGYDQKEIAEKLGFSPLAVSDVLKQPHIQAYMIEQLDESQDNFREQIIAEGKAAFARTVDLAKNSSSEKIQADLNKYLVDRFLGRAVQPIENITQPVESMSDDELRKALPELLKAQHNPEARRDSETPLSPDRVSVPEVESSPIDDFILDGQSPQTSATE